MNNERRVVITGIGPICSLGIGKEEVWDNLRKGCLGLSKKTFKVENNILAKDYQYQVRKYSLSDYINNRYKLKELLEWKRGQEVEDLNLILVSIAIALKDAKLNKRKRSRKIKLGLILSHENPGLECLLTSLISASYKVFNSKKDIEFKEYFEKIYNITERNAYETQGFMFLYHASKIHDIHGYSLVINNACSSGLYAIEAGANVIRNGDNDVMVISASDYPDIYKYLWLKNLGLFAEDGKIKPFSKERNGFIFGEGGSALILEEYDHAVKRNACIYAEYLGGGFTQDAWKVTAPDITGKYYHESIRAGFIKCSIDKGNICLINAHGIGTRVGDSYEASAISEVFGRNMPVVTAFKPYIGHNLGGSALIETVLLVISMNNGIVPPVLNCEKYDESLLIKIAENYITLPDNYNVLKMSASFGGFNGAIILNKKKDFCR